MRRKHVAILLGVGGKLWGKTIRNCWKKADLCFMEDKQTDNDENCKSGDVSDAEKCVLSFQKSLTQLEEKSGKMSEINVEEYLTVNDDLMVFSGVTEEDILSEIRDEMENDNSENDDHHTENHRKLFNQFSPYGHSLQAFHSKMMIIFVHQSSSAQTVGPDPSGVGSLENFCKSLNSKKFT
ncbi:hypothetical protein AVEN_196641-1 [Araneus ventricosus]|uniref:Uncharacterized protein n=1 Tax=Araneus ventricosus TaxID=182803 RepID=A0A4Y2E6T1_ARAVE|nr:hypothetical protein AVEN_196641-1 [Araneus ventricosus]